jgi:GNAT superfamily N-acetyltransferase
MPHYHPERSEDLELRNALLQECLRPEPLPFPIEEEYPLVLSAGDTRFSYCMNNGDKLCSHANLWPRRVLDSQGRERYRIGLVGNVATDPGLQGKGLMRQLIAELADVARTEKLDALVLWSDLTQFYHKLGFASVGKEFHFSIRTHEIQGSLNPDIRINPALNPEMLQELLALRIPLALTLERSPAEFLRMLSIPWLDLFLLEKAGRICGYVISGKGYDMLGVIHEWGVREARDLPMLIENAARFLQMEKILLLAPGRAPEPWKNLLKDIAVSSETQPMALIHCVTPGLKADDFAELFIWGPDSI